MAHSADTRGRVLQMLADGVITAEEANDLLNALGGSAAAGSHAPRPALSGAVASRPPPGLRLYRRLWQAGTLAVMAFALFGALGLALLYSADKEVSRLALAGFWAIFLAGAAGAALGWLAKRSTWLYLNVQPADGPRIALGLPMPLALAGGALRLARPFVPAEHAASFQMAAEFVAAVRHNPGREPLQLQVDDAGARVEIYLG